MAASSIQGLILEIGCNLSLPPVAILQQLLLVIQQLLHSKVHNHRSTLCQLLQQYMHAHTTVVDTATMIDTAVKHNC